METNKTSKIGGVISIVREPQSDLGSRNWKGWGTCPWVLSMTCEKEISAVLHIPIYGADRNTMERTLATCFCNILNLSKEFQRHTGKNVKGQPQSSLLGTGGRQSYVWLHRHMFVFQKL